MNIITFPEDHGCDTDSLCMPFIILWNPYLIYPKLVPPGSILCHCGLETVMHHWNDGTTEDKQPRILHGIKNIGYLVSSVYSCDNNHKIMAHDELVLSKLSSKIMIPFVLFYRTALTRDLIDMVIALVRKGMNFYNIESLILEQRWEYFSRKQDICEKDTSTINFFDMALSKSPSNDILSKAFLAVFLEKEQLYLQEMSNVPIGESLSFDHTFKVAANIGYLREDGKWITEYDGLFLVLNSNGQVVAWQLTKSTSIAESDCLLKNLTKRAKLPIKTLYVDNCCKLRNKIKAIFGSNVSVKLDLFHAVQRISRTLSKKHILSRQCLRDLRLVFRSNGDIEENRKSATTSSDIMILKLESFLVKWKDTRDNNNVKLFKTETVTALHNLKGHITNDCLSDIPPGGGTNKNERFHEYLNSFFHRSRIGILLAYALLTVVIHAHNNALKINGKSLSKPIAASSLRYKPIDISIYPMGISFKKQYRKAKSRLLGNRCNK